MTNEEARNYVLQHILIGNEMQNDAMLISTQALEKQIPKKPVRPTDSYNSFCPECNNIVGFYIGDIYKSNYCDSCGQAIDWSGEE